MNDFEEEKNLSHKSILFYVLPIQLLAFIQNIHYTQGYKSINPPNICLLFNFKDFVYSYKYVGHVGHTGHAGHILVSLPLVLDGAIAVRLHGDVDDCVGHAVHCHYAHLVVQDIAGRLHEGHAACGGHTWHSGPLISTASCRSNRHTTARQQEVMYIHMQCVFSGHRNQ